jgi:hypothetical protein
MPGRRYGRARTYGCRAGGEPTAVQRLITGGTVRENPVETGDLEDFHDSRLHGTEMQVTPALPEDLLQAQKNPYAGTADVRDSPHVEKDDTILRTQIFPECLVETKRSCRIDPPVKGEYRNVTRPFKPVLHQEFLRQQQGDCAPSPPACRPFTVRTVPHA